MSLENKALIVSLSVSQWTGRKTDRKATATVAAAHNTKGGAGNYTKKLLPGAAELQRIGEIVSKIRAFHYQETLPWMSDGSRILAASNYMHYTAGYRKLRDEFSRAVEDFIAVYPTLQAAAMQSLGSLYSPADYPSPNRLRECFSISADFFPVPAASDFRVTILEEEKAALTENIRKAESAAMRDCWERLHGVVKTAAQKLAQPDAIFRDSLIENISEICGMLPRLNYSDDPALETMRKDVEKLVAGLKPDTLRAHAPSRQDAATALNDITAKMAAFMGGDAPSTVATSNDGKAA